MKILIIPSWYYTNDNPLAGVFFKEFAELLAKRGNKVAIVYVDIKFGMKFKNIGYEHKIVNNVEEYRYNIKNITPRFIKGAEIQEIFALKKILKELLSEFGKPDVIHLESFVKISTAKYLIKKLKTPLVYTEHFSYVLKGGNKYYEKRLKEALNIADKCCAVSNKLANAMKMRVDRDIKVVPNIINISEKIEFTTSNIFKVKALGTLVTIKRYDILIKAFSEFQKGKANVELVIGGHGTEKQKLQRIADECKIKNKVSFIGMINREDVGDFYSDCSVFVCSSETETFSIVTAEALCSGVPVVSTKCGGPDDMIKDENGILVEVNNVDQMAEALDYVYKNYDKYNRSLIADEAKRKFGSDSIIEVQKKIYMEAVNKSNI